MGDEPENTGGNQGKRDANGRFLPGQSGNPAGKPKGSKHKLEADFFRDLYEVWGASGAQSLVDMIKTDPGAFVRVVAGLMPKEMKTEIDDKRNVVRLPEDVPSTEAWLEKYAPKERHN